MTQRDRIKECNDRLTVLYKWYQEKSERGFHKEFSFEWIKTQIMKWEALLTDAQNNWNSNLETKD